MQQAQAANTNQSKALEVAIRILRGALAAKASDIHLRVGVQPRVRIQGQLCPLDHPPIGAEVVDACVSALAGIAQVPVERLQRLQHDFSCYVPEVGRFRVHAYRAGGQPAVTLRCIAAKIPDFATLRLPPVVKRIASAERGLILVTGATGNGKSTTIAAMLQYVNERLPRHVVTLEDPIEYIFDDNVASFSQREVGRDVQTFQSGLEGVLREDPDVVFIGEIRNIDEFEIALNAAESGRLVISTLHSSDVERAISRMVSLYKPEYRDSARSRIADVIQGIVAQRLIPKNGASEHTLLTEVLTRSPTVLDCIREPSKVRGLRAALEAGTSEYGCHCFDQVLRSMVKDKIISMETALANAYSSNDFTRSMKLMR